MMNTNYFENLQIFVTGGTGTWGQSLIRSLLKLGVARVIVFSRNEKEQVAMQRLFDNEKLHFVIGDVRDKYALETVFENNKIDLVFHLAALKHVPICEYQLEEAVKTNVLGTSNVIKVAGKNKVIKVLLVSTDKAVEPINAYGYTKATAEKLIIQANLTYPDTDFICVRAGNVLGSNGSFIPWAIEQVKENKDIPLTSMNISRYFIHIKSAIDFVLFAMENGIGGETYIPLMKSFSIKTMINVIKNHYKSSSGFTIIGIREGEKLHESLISEDEVIRAEVFNYSLLRIKPNIKIDKNYYHPQFDNYKENCSYVQKSDYISSKNICDEKETMEFLKQGGLLV